MRRAFVIAFVLASPTVHADSSPPERGASDEPTAADAEGAPLPGEESGRTDDPAGDSTLRNIGQGVLIVPRIAVEAVVAPIRVSVWAFDRYRLSERFTQTFFDKTATYGLYPLVNFDSTYGLNAGARLVHRNVFGARERISVLATTGGRFRSLVDGRLRSGMRLGKRLTLELRGEHERRPREAYYGIGNADDRVRTRFREEVERATTYLDVVVVDRLVVRATGALTEREFSPATEGVPIDAMYDTMTLTGFSGVENTYGELELRWDRRGREITAGTYEVYDTGFMLSAFGGRVHQMQGAGADHWRYGGEAQHFLGLGPGPRTLMTRLHVESVTGERSDVVFNQLPALGGHSLLRGYALGRFRDRAAIVGSTEYIWGLGRLFVASLFVDVGRVYPSLAEVDTSELRLGFGGSLQLHGNRQFISGLTVSSSIDGGVFVNVTFDPVFDYDSRGERR